MTSPSPALSLDLQSAAARAKMLADDEVRIRAEAEHDPRLPFVAEVAYEASARVGDALGGSSPRWTAVSETDKAAWRGRAVLALMGVTAAVLASAMDGSLTPFRAEVKGSSPGAASDGQTSTAAGRQATLILEVSRSTADALSKTSPGAYPSVVSAALTKIGDAKGLLELAKTPHATEFAPEPEQFEAAAKAIAAKDGKAAQRALDTTDPPFPGSVARSVIHAIRGDLLDKGFDPGPRRNVGVTVEPPKAKSTT
jgi:hypothetical protein